MNTIKEISIKDEHLFNSLIINDYLDIDDKNTYNKNSMWDISLEKLINDNMVYFRNKNQWEKWIDKVI